MLLIVLEAQRAIIMATKVGIIGYGYVGKAMHRFFATKYDTVWYDPFVEGSCTKEEVNSCDLGVVCVMTACNPADNSCDVSIVEEVVGWLKTPLVLIKSTVAPGTTDRLREATGKRIVFSPEYIGESDYDTGKHGFNKEAAKTPFVTVGGDKADVADVLDMMVPVMGPNRTFHGTDAITAELAKYMENCYLATKVVFCYEFERICAAYGASYTAVRECWLLDPRMESSHSAVFRGPRRPYEGKCLPKDVKAMVCASEERGYDPRFLKEVVQSNDRIGRLRGWSGKA